MTDSPPVDPEPGAGSAQLAKRTRTPASSVPTSRSGGRPASGTRRSSADTDDRTAERSNGAADTAAGAGETTKVERAVPPGSGAGRGPAGDALLTGPPGSSGPRSTVDNGSADVAPAQGTATRLLGYRRQRFEARKVRRLIRHVDPWSMLKLSLLVSLCMWLMVMIAAVILWTVARNAGTIASVENFVNSSLSLQDWSLDGEFIFRQFGLVTLLLALGLAASLVIATLVFNLISDIIGGVWVSVIEEETARPVVESNR